MGRRRREGDALLAVGYCRVSTDEQRLGVEAQRAALESWSRAHGVELVAVHVDHGISGAASIEKRRALFDALAEVRARGAGVLLVARLDRIARDVALAALIGEQARRRGARIVACDGGGDGGDEPAERLMRDVLFAFAAHERRMVAARTAAALAAKRARGERYCATPRLGERFAADGRLETDQAEARAVALISRLRARGLSVRGIVAELERRPQYRPRGRCWHATTVVRVLRRAEG